MIVSKKIRLSSLTVLGAIVLAGSLFATPAAAQTTGFINCVPDTHVRDPKPDVTIYGCNSTSQTSGCTQSKWGGGRVDTAICAMANSLGMGQNAGDGVTVRLPSQYCPTAAGTHSWPAHSAKLKDCCKWVPGTGSTTGSGGSSGTPGRWEKDTKPACDPKKAYKCVRNGQAVTWDYTSHNPLATSDRSTLEETLGLTDRVTFEY